MNLEIFAICDAASESAGKINILGAFDLIMTPNLPGFHPACSIVARIRFREPDETEYKVSIEIMDDLEEPLIPKYEQVFKVDFKGSVSATSNFIINIQSLPIRRYREHTIKLSINDNLISSIPLFVKQPSESKT